ncbi:MAG: 2-dehydropantoate 2-reductase [Chitinivibrionales bacterium]|nr:2-dehydropantoate 2-reductase [Chitinivibrionales bacterium]
MAKIHYIIQGAGSIGSALGAFLHKAGMPVTLIARKPHVVAIRQQKGLAITTLSGDEIVAVQAATSFEELPNLDNAIIFQTMKAPDTRDGIEQIAAIGRDFPVVCCQNGVGSEELASTALSSVYAGVIRFTATLTQPGAVSFAGSGKIILGKYPAGSDELVEKIAVDLSRTPLHVITSASIMEDKWLKVLVNLISGIRPLTRKVPGEERKRTRLCKNVLQEGISVLHAAGISARSTNGTEDSAEEMLAKFESTLALADGKGQGMALRNSTWQSLAHSKKTLENDWYTGKIIELGEAQDVPTPYNSAVLEALHACTRNELGPESVDIDDILIKASRFTTNRK